MYQRRRTRVVLAALVVASLGLITLHFRTGADGPLHAVRSTAVRTIEPAQAAVASVVGPLRGLADEITGLLDLRADNARLEQRMAELERRWQSLADLQRENGRLRELVGLRQRTGFDTVAATVVALAPSHFEWTATINAGSNAGVARDMPVVNGDGLVGRVIQVTPRAARVLLAIDPNFSAAVRDARLGETGPLHGQGADLMHFEPLDPNAAVEVGDEIVTSSYSDGIFPAGIPVGAIDEVVADDSLLSRSARVRPYVDFTRLEHVAVVQYAGGEPLPSVDPATAPFDPPRLLPPSQGASADREASP